MSIATENPQAGPESKDESGVDKGTPAAPESPPAPASAASWRDNLPEEIRGLDTLKKFADVPALAKSYADLERHMGGTLRKPEATDKPEVWAEFYNKLGRPEKPEGYGFKKPENLPAQAAWSDEKAAGFAKLAHDIGLTKDQANKLMEYHNADLMESAKSFWSPERGLAHVKGIWKSDTELNTNIGLVNRVVAEFANDEMREFLDRSGVGNYPPFLEMMAKVGKSGSEPSDADSGAHGSAGLSAAEAQAEINRIRGDKTHPYNNGSHPEHMAALEEMKLLYGAAHKGKNKVLVELGGFSRGN